jgi:hypothetical protein
MTHHVTQRHLVTWFWCLEWSKIQPPDTWSCSMLRYPTLDATTSKCIVSNRYSRNCSTPILKIVSGQGGSLHCILCVIPGVTRPGGAELGPMALVLGMGKIRLPDAGVSLSLALDQRQRWEWSKIWLPDVGASISLALDERRVGNRANSAP